MKQFLIIIIFVAMTSSFALSQTTDKQKSRNAKIEQELIKLEEEWHNAYVRHDAEPLERILADEYIAVGGNGSSSSKAQSIEGLKADKSTYEYSTPYDMDFRFYGDTVVVIGRTKEKGKAQNGSEFSVEYRWTDVFVKRKGRWQCVAAQVARVPPPKSTSTQTQPVDSVKKELEALYTIQDEAIKKLDFKAFVGTLTPDYSVKLLNGAAFNRPQIDDAIKNDMARTVSVAKSISIINNLTIKGDEAIVNVTHEASRILNDAQGNPHQWDNKVIHQETWIRTTDGWRIKSLEEVKQVYLLRDSKPLNS